MPAKKKKQVGGTRNQVQPRPMKGRGYWKQKGNGFWDWISGAAKDVGNYVVKNVKPSAIAKLIPHPYAQGLAAGAQQLGLGKQTGGRCSKI